jgi:hypothetical protein
VQLAESCRGELSRREKLRGAFNLLCCHKADSDPYRMLALLKAPSAAAVSTRHEPTRSCPNLIAEDLKDLDVGVVGNGRSC